MRTKLHCALHFLTSSHARTHARTHASSSMAAAAALFCFVVLLASCLLASMALMLGYYGTEELVAGSGCSRLVRASSFFVQGITVRRAGGEEDGLVLYGLAGAPRLDVVPAAWSEARRVVLPANSHREWVYFLNRGSQIEVHYSVKPTTVSIYSLCIIVAQGNGSFTRWTEKSPVHSTWRAVHGSGTIKQTIESSHEYYIAVGNLDDHDATVLLDFRINAVFYNTTGADYACSPGKSPCTYRLPILGQNAAVLSSGFKERLNSDDDERYVKVELSYVPRWIVYVVGSAILAVSLLLLYEVLCSLFGFCTWGGSSSSPADQRTSLLTNKEEEDAASLGSSYDSVSDDDDVEKSGEAGRHLCVVCCDARKDCFFLPCGHSATCHTCGTRIQEGDGSCPICRRKLKKVRRIFAV